MVDQMLQDKYDELGKAHVKLVEENEKLRELVKEAIPAITAYSVEYYDCKEEWLAKAKVVLSV